MRVFSTYSVKINESAPKAAFKDTVALYRQTVDFFIGIAVREWDAVSSMPNAKERLSYMEALTVATKQRPKTAYCFGKLFYKFPSYYRRAAINEALGKVSSYMSNLRNWETSHIGKKPGFPRAGHVYPALYRGNSFVRVDDYTAQIKAYIRNTWDWITISLRKSDADYIRRHCKSRVECVPTLQKRGKQWFLDFAFEERCELVKDDVFDQTVLAVDLGINNACTYCVMNANGTILGREFLSLPREYDCLDHAISRIKKAQQHGAHRSPKLWAAANGINDDIAVKTAHFIVDAAVKYSAFVIVFEHLDVGGKKRGSKKQRLHLWRARYVQRMVTDKAHRLGIRISRINAWNTSRLAYDGSGRVQRGKEAELPSYSLCRFQNGKVYNCDMNASYNIGARYFVREICKSLPARVRLDIEAKVPQCSKRSTCTLSSLIRLNAAFSALRAAG